MDNRDVNLIEKFKYFLAIRDNKDNKDKHSWLIFTGSKPRDISIVNESITTPEDKLFFVEKFIVCYEEQGFSFDLKEKIGKITGILQEKISGLQLSSQKYVEDYDFDQIAIKYNPDDTERKCYIFTSDFYKNLNEEFLRNIRAEYRHKNYFESHRDNPFYPYSVIIVIKDNYGGGYDFTQFEEFLKLNYNTWKTKFQSAVNIALDNEFSNFELLGKYDPEILIYELTLDERIKLINKIIDQYWGILSNWWYEFNQQDFILNLIEKIKDSEARLLYNKVFENKAKLFRKIVGKFDYDGQFKLNTILIRFFYLKQTPAELENLKQQIRNNNDINRIIPIIQSNIGNFKEIGTSPKIYYDENFVNISFIDTNVLKYNGVNLYVRNFGASSDNPFYYLAGKKFGYEEIIFGLTVREKQEAGISPGKIIAMPAFALNGINEGFSDHYTLKDVLKDVAFSVGFIMPFFGLAESISLGLASKLEIFTTTAGLFKSVSDNFLDNYLRPYLLADPTGNGAVFLKQYYFISTFYDTTTLNITFINKGISALADYEFLLATWANYEGTTSYQNLDKENANFKKIDLEMKKIKQYYEQKFKK